MHAARSTSPFGRRLALLAAGGLLAGCSFFAPRPDPSQFYILTPVVEPAARNTSGASYGLGPVHVPDYLKRPTIVTRTSDAQITPSPVDRWGEPFDKGVSVTLQEDLRRATGTERVLLFPWYASERPDYQVVVDILRLERDPDDRATLVARWEIRRTTPDSDTIRTGETSLVREPSGSGTAASINAQSEALGQLANEIAAALLALPKQ